MNQHMLHTSSASIKSSEHGSASAACAAGGPTQLTSHVSSCTSSILQQKAARSCVLHYEIAWHYLISTTTWHVLCICCVSC